MTEMASKDQYLNLQNVNVAIIDRERFWRSCYENTVPLDIESGQGLEIMLWDIVNLLK